MRFVIVLITNSGFAQGPTRVRGAAISDGWKDIDNVS